MTFVIHYIHVVQTENKINFPFQMLKKILFLTYKK